jgi:hypothetical protein
MSGRISQTLVLLSILGLTSAAHARVAGGYVGGGARVFEDDWVPMTSVHGYLNIDTMIDLTADLHVRPFGIDQEAVEIAGGSVGFSFIPPIPGPIGAEVGLTGGMLRPGALTDQFTESIEDEYLPVFTYEFAATVTLFPLVRLRASYQSALGSPAGTAKRLFGSQFLVMLGVGI